MADGSSEIVTAGSEGLLVAGGGAAAESGEKLSAVKVPNTISAGTRKYSCKIRFKEHPWILYGMTIAEHEATPG